MSEKEHTEEIESMEESFHELFISPSAGNKNKITKKSAGKKVFICSYCGKSFGSRSGYRRHETCHSKSPFECVVCKNMFSDKHHYAGHMNLCHMKNKPCKCTSCKTSYAYKTSFTRHMKECQPTTEKPSFRCAICGRDFTRKDLLADHIRGVHQEKQYHCCKCNKSFRNRSGRSKHMKKC